MFSTLKLICYQGVLERALGGLRTKLQGIHGNSPETEWYKRQQRLLEKELSRVRSILALNSKVNQVCYTSLSYFKIIVFYLKLALMFRNLRKLLLKMQDQNKNLLSFGRNCNYLEELLSLVEPILLLQRPNYVRFNSWWEIYFDRDKN